MKWFVLLTVAIAASSASVINDIQKEKEGDRFFYFPGDGDNKLHLVDSEEPVDEAVLADFTRNPNDNAYWLFTRVNPSTPEILKLNDVNSIATSHFTFSKPTVFLAHGWNGHGGNNMNKLLTEAFLEDKDVNVIVLDWSKLANRGYTTAKRGAAAVGKGLGQFINWLVGFGLSYEKVHLVGFSLGGHLVGNAGRETEGRIRRITALDPAGPLWTRDNGRIVPSDAQYVEVIHTNTALYGYSDPCGDADFYPNGGSSMPGCFLNTCSHSLAWEYMAATVFYDNLIANECDTVRDATRNRCNGDLNPMGNSYLYKSRSGIFRVNTSRRWPF